MRADNLAANGADPARGRGDRDIILDAWRRWSPVTPSMRKDRGAVAPAHHRPFKSHDRQVLGKASSAELQRRPADAVEEYIRKPGRCHEFASGSCAAETRNGDPLRDREPRKRAASRSRTSVGDAARRDGAGRRTGNRRRLARCARKHRRIAADICKATARSRTWPHLARRPSLVARHLDRLRVATGS